MDKPYLTLVDSHAHDSEFIPLPYYAWDERPTTLPLDPDECATAIHIAQGDIPKAAALLKVSQHLLERELRRHPRLVRILNEELQLAVSRSRSEYLSALTSDNDRRREWAASKILSSRIAQSDPFAPAPSQPNAVQASLSINQAREIVFSWRQPAPPVILDHDEGRGGSDDSGVA